MKYLFILLLIALPVHAKTYFVDIDFMMPLDCTNPTHREDGTPLLLSEIAEIQWNIWKDAEQYTVSMIGGCTPIDFDLSVLTVGKWNKEALTIDTGGRTSVVIKGLPFDYVLFVANPNGPVIIEP